MTSSIYFMRPVGMRGPIKIGYSVNPKKRLHGVLEWSPFDLEIIATTPGNAPDETKVHDHFASAHVRGEWFHPTEELLALIDRVKAGEPLSSLIDMSERVSALRRARALRVWAKRKAAVREKQHD